MAFGQFCGHCAPPARDRRDTRPPAQPRGLRRHEPGSGRPRPRPGRHQLRPGWCRRPAAGADRAAHSGRFHVLGAVRRCHGPGVCGSGRCRRDCDEESQPLAVPAYAFLRLATPRHGSRRRCAPEAATRLQTLIPGGCGKPGTRIRHRRRGSRCARFWNVEPGLGQPVADGGRFPGTARGCAASSSSADRPPRAERSPLLQRRRSHQPVLSTLPRSTATTWSSGD